MKTFTKAIIDSHSKCGLTAMQWFTHMVDDVLAGFGLKLKTIPDSTVTAHLFELSGLYAQQVIENKPFTDLLGPVYMDLISQYHQQASGQFFTPVSICQLLASINLGAAPVDLDNPRVLRISDPAVGAGGLLLASLDHIATRQGVDALKWISITGIDVDHLCARMFPCQILSALHVHQLTLGELVGYWGNTLGDLADLTLVCHYVREDLPADDISPAGTDVHKSALVEQIQGSRTVEQIELF